MTAPKITRRTLDDGTEILETSDRFTAQQVADLYDVTPCLILPYRGACPPGVECGLCDPQLEDLTYRPTPAVVLVTAGLGAVIVGAIALVLWVIWQLGAALLLMVTA